MVFRIWRVVNNVHWFIDQAEHRREATNRRQGRILTYQAVEAGGNNYLIVLVAGLGFFTDSYLLFATPSINPMVSYIYWTNATRAKHELAVNLATLGGCVLGMLLFGWLSDTFGRRKIYGHELLLLLVGTIGVVMSSPGYALPIAAAETESINWSRYGSMDIFSWLVFWRFVSGVGLGGDYPLSSTIVSEFAPKRRRARMLAVVFSAQAFGYLTANLVSLIVTVIVQHHHPEASPRSVDQIWRWVIGLALIPGSAAAVLRLTIPESPRYTLDVSDNITKAFDETNRFNNANLGRAWAKQANIDTIGAALAADNDEAHEFASSSVTYNDAVDVIETDQSQIRAKQYFLRDGNWVLLLGTSLCWFLLDIGFYALSLSNWQQTLSKLWYQDADSNSDRPVWDTNPNIKNPTAGIYTILITNSAHSMVISSIGAVTGALTMIYLIDKVNRRKFQLASFLVLAGLFIITGATFSSTVQTGFHGVTIMLFVLCQLVFYCGPNTLTFVIPAELFPTKYRATCHGISAAAGKVGSMITQIFLAFVQFDNGNNVVKSSDPDSKWLGWVLMIFSLPMVVGAGLTWWLIPDVQDKGRNAMSLEELVFVRQRCQGRSQDIEMTSDAGSTT